MNQFLCWFVMNCLTEPASNFVRSHTGPQAIFLSVTSTLKHRDDNHFLELARMPQLRTMPYIKKKKLYAIPMNSDGRSAFFARRQRREEPSPPQSPTIPHPCGSLRVPADFALCAFGCVGNEAATVPRFGLSKLYLRGVCGRLRTTPVQSAQRARYSLRFSSMN